MKLLPVAMGVILLVAFVIVPAGAFRAQDLRITVNENGDAQVDFSYQLNWLEQAAVFTKVVDPGQQLKSALENNFHVSVTVNEVSPGESTLNIHSFATIKKTPYGLMYSTPALSFQNAQRALNQYWFAPLINPDFSPDITQITFPDGYHEEFYNQIAIPAISHTIST
jgi:hypothetical protein